MRSVLVAPLVGAWIEINTWANQTRMLKSLPLWERGLKSYGMTRNMEIHVVAPLVGAWIEIKIAKLPQKWELVAPLVGAWIEIICWFTM